uniref:Uncharacterized protein n=1 Tax=viral metagenome TaxID=1070528 RepID=A0A6C0CHY5_9ZZZZ
MFKTSHLVLVGLMLVVLYFTVIREHLTVNKDSSKNWDVPERSSLPLGTPQEQEIQDMKSRIKSLEQAVKDLKTKMH